MLISDSGRLFIKHWEGLKLKAYPDPGSGGHPWTIGWGHTPSKEGAVITLSQAEKLFNDDVREVGVSIGELVTVPLSQGQTDALGSFLFNLGRQ